MVCIVHTLSDFVGPVMHIRSLIVKVCPVEWGGGVKSGSCRVVIAHHSTVQKHRFARRTVRCSKFTVSEGGR